MAGAGTEVGRISIKVTPDTDGFREALRRQLKAATAGLDADVPTNLKGGEKVEAQLDALARNRKAKIEVETSFADRAFLRVRQIIAAMMADGKKLDKIFEQAAIGLEQKIAKVPTKPELVKGWEEDIRMELMRMESLAVDMKPRIGKGDIGQETLAAMAHAQFIANARKIKFQAEVVVDNNRLRRAFAGITGSFSGLKGETSDLFRSIGRSIAEAGDNAMAAVGGFRAFGVGLGVMLAAAVLVPPALSVLAGSLLTLPGLLTGMLVPMAAVALGLDGIKKAAEDSGLFDPTGGAKGEGGVGKAFDSIRKAVSETFERGLKPAFQGIADLLPSLTGGFQQVAQGLSDIATQGVQGITNRLPQVQSIISNIGVGLSNAAPGIRDFTSALIQLTEGLAQKFPSLGTAFSNMMSDFLQWVDRFTFKDPITGASQFDAVLHSLKETANALWGALGKIMGVSLDNLSRPDFGQGMKNFFKAVEDFVTNTLPSLQRGFEAIATLADKLSPVFRAMNLLANGSDLIKDFFTEGSKPGGMVENSKALKDMQARMEAMKNSGGSFWDQWLAGATDTGAPTKSLFDNVQPAAVEAGKQSAVNLWEGFRQGVPAGTPITGAEQALTPVVDQAKMTGQQAYTAFKQGLTEAGPQGGLESAFVQPIQQGAQQAQVASGQMAQSVQSDTAQAISLIAGLGDTASATAAQWSNIIQVMGTGAGQAVAAVTAQFGNIPRIVMGSFQGVQSAVAGAMGAVVSAVASSGSQISSAMSGAMVELTRVVITSMAQLPGVIKSGMDAMNAALQAGGAMAVQTVSAWGAQMVSTAMAFAGAMQGAGASVGAAFAAGLNSMTGVVSAAAANLMAAARPMFPNSPAKDGPFSGRGWVTFSGQAVGEGFADGMNSSVPDVVSAAKAMMQAIKDVFGSAEGLTLNFNFGGGSGGSFGGYSGAYSALPASMADTAASAKDYQSSLSDAVLPSKALTAEDKTRLEELKRQLAELEIQRKTLMGLKYADPKNEAIKAELNHINQLKNAIGLEKNKLEYAQKYAGTVDETSNSFNDQLKTLTQMPLDFARTASSSFMNDFGISGGGVLGAAMDWGMGFAGNASQFVFNVNSVDDALAARDRTVMRQSMGVL